MRIWTLANTLLTLVCVGCCAFLLWRELARKEPPPEKSAYEVRDLPLRTFLNVRSLGGEVQLPDDAKYVAVVAMKFEDGQYVGQASPRQLWPWFETAGPPRLPFLVMWGQTPRGTKVAWHMAGGTFDTTDEFFSDLGGFLASNQKVEPAWVVRGCRAFGVAGSQEMRQGREKQLEVFGGSANTPQHCIDNRKRVLVTAVKSFDTHEDAEAWVHHGD